ncbi:TPA: hypothetical protein ACPJ2O_004451 [Vibrio diabolicus]
MSWKFEEVKDFLEKMQFSMGAVASCNGGAMLRSNYLALSHDVNEVNAVASYVYGSNENNAALIQLSASKGSKGDLVETELNFAALVAKVASFFSGSNSELPDTFELPTQTYVIGDYTLRVDSEDNQSNAFIALSVSFEQAMEVRNKLLYSEV